MVLPSLFLNPGGLKVIKILSHVLSLPFVLLLKVVILVWYTNINHHKEAEKKKYFGEIVQEKMEADLQPIQHTNIDDFRCGIVVKGQL